VFDVVIRPVWRRGERLHYSGGAWYEFTVAGKRFREFVDVVEGNTAEDVRAGMPTKGQVVTVHYDAADPENNALTPWRPTPDSVRVMRTAGYGMMGGGLFFVALGGTVLWVYRRSGDALRGQRPLVRQLGEDA
jgi:hypothetical protein